MSMYGMSRDQNVDLIVKTALEFGITDKRHIAYMLATAQHETGDFNHAREIGGAQPHYRGGENYFGRGYPQITHIDRYDAVDDLLGLNGRLKRDPDLAARDPNIAADALVAGMMRGLYTNANLELYVNSEKTDYYNARRTINGTDVADRVAGYAQQWEKDLPAIIDRLNQQGITPRELPGNLFQDGRLSNGEIGPEVARMQEGLIAKGYQLAPDGNFGNGTQRQLEKFQQAQGLPVTGYADQATLDALGVQLRQVPSTQTSPNQAQPGERPTGNEQRQTPPPHDVAPTIQPLSPTSPDLTVPTSPQTGTPKPAVISQPQETAPASLPTTNPVPSNPSPDAPETRGRIVPPTGFGTWPTPNNYEPNPPIIGDPRYGTPRGAPDGHAGIDIRGNIGDPVVAFKAGVVDPLGGISYDGNAGWLVQIKHDDGTYTMYQHLKERPNLELGQKVEEGQQIGQIGDSGNAKGVPQLHFEVRRGDGSLGDDVNPSEFVQHLGSFGPAVKELKENLAKLGYDPGSPTSDVFDDKTKAAVLAWQKDNNLPQTGAVDGNSIEAIRNPERYREGQNINQPAPPAQPSVQPPVQPESPPLNPTVSPPAITQSNATRLTDSNQDAPFTASKAVTTNDLGRNDAAIAMSPEHRERTQQVLKAFESMPAGTFKNEEEKIAKATEAAATSLVGDRPLNKVESARVINGNLYLGDRADMLDSTGRIASVPMQPVKSVEDSVRAVNEANRTQDKLIEAKPASPEPISNGFPKPGQPGFELYNDALKALDKLGLPQHANDPDAKRRDALTVAAAVGEMGGQNISSISTVRGPSYFTAQDNNGQFYPLSIEQKYRAPEENLKVLNEAARGMAPANDNPAKEIESESRQAPARGR
jgi:murein DD-endopeptidase MepM/ murein hydrolase activator NlpD/predicted chitinase